MKNGKSSAKHHLIHKWISRALIIRGAIFSFFIAKSLLGFFLLLFASSAYDDVEEIQFLLENEEVYKLRQHVDKATFEAFKASESFQ